MKKLFFNTKTITAVIFCFLLKPDVSGQEKAIRPQPGALHFDVIIGLSGENAALTASRIKKRISSPSSGLAYKGFCENQKCVVLEASADKYLGRDNVVNFLKTEFKNEILGYKDYTVEEFYKTCRFSTPDETKYFKNNYGQ
jgi:hypothetical protein